MNQEALQPQRTSRRSVPRVALAILVTMFVGMGMLGADAALTGSPASAAAPASAHAKAHVATVQLLADYYEPIDTPFAISWGGCNGTAEFGNIYGIAFASVTVSTSGCSIATYVIGVLNGNFVTGPTVTATYGHPAQSNYLGASVFAQWIGICSPSLCNLGNDYSPF